MQTVPLQWAAAAGSKRVKAVQDPVTGHLDAANWKQMMNIQEHWAQRLTI